MTASAPGARAPGAMEIHWFALVTSILPLITLHVAYLVSAAEGYISWCVPYLERCASISATGRHGTAYVLFKAGMLPSAVLVVGYWGLVTAWLRRRGTPLASCLVFPVIGVVGGIGLVLYIALLGSFGEEHRLLRRLGIIVYLGTTVLASMLFILQLARAARRGAAVPGLVGALRFKLALSVLLLVLGVGSVILQVIWPGYGTIENAVEWGFVALMACYPLGTAFLWRRDGSRLELSTS